MADKQPRTGVFGAIARILCAFALVAAVGAVLVELAARPVEREAAAWQVLNAPVRGNTGAIFALEYLNRDNPLVVAIPNPMRWSALSRRPRAGEIVHVPSKYWFREKFVFGPWKRRSALFGIDLAGPIDPDTNKCLGGTGSGAYLRGVKLDGAVMREAKLACANLFGASFAHARLFLADFSGAKLGVANLSQSDLRHARLVGVMALGAHFEGAHLFGADLSHAKLLTARLAHADMGMANLTDANLDFADLSGATLWRADLSHARLRRAKLAGADLRGTQLADLSYKSLTQEQLDTACTGKPPKSDAETSLPDYLVAPKPCRFDRHNRPVLAADGLPVRVE